VFGPALGALDATGTLDALGALDAAAGGGGVLVEAGMSAPTDRATAEAASASLGAACGAGAHAASPRAIAARAHGVAANSSIWLMAVSLMTSRLRNEWYLQTSAIH